MLLRLLGQGGKRRLEKEIVVPLDGMTDEWLIASFFAMKKEGMRRGLLSRYGYRRRQDVRDSKVSGVNRDTGSRSKG